jgi:hypothetical protein
MDHKGKAIARESPAQAPSRLATQTPLNHERKEPFDVRRFFVRLPGARPTGKPFRKHLLFAQPVEQLAATFLGIVLAPIRETA